MLELPLPPSHSMRPVYALDLQLEPYSLARNCSVEVASSLLQSAETRTSSVLAPVLVPVRSDNRQVAQVGATTLHASAIASRRWCPRGGLL